MYLIDHTPTSQQHFRRSVQLASIDQVLPDRDVHTICRELGYAWRNRQLPPGLMVRSMIYRGLSPDRSITAVLADLSALVGTDQIASDSAWCQARACLPKNLLTTLNVRFNRRMRRRFGRQHTWHGRPVFIVDGTGISMPDTPSLAKAFGYTRSKQYASRFPVARVTIIGLAGVNTIWDHRINEWRCSEDQQFHDMWHTLPRSSICLFDRYFSSFYNLVKLRQRGISVISRLHQRRDPQRLIRQGRSLGRNQWLVPFELAPQIRKRYDDPTLPRRLWVRLIRASFLRNGTRRHHWLVTTLIDSKRYLCREIVSLYRQRWEIETRLGEVKTTLQADILHSKKPDGVRQELSAILLGHNVVWWLIHLAAEKTSTQPEHISFACATKAILAFSHEIARSHGSQQHSLFETMLRHIAKCTNNHPPNRVEPRMIKRNPVRYCTMRIPRSKARLNCLT